MSGAVVFEGWQLSGARVITPHVNQSTGIEGNALVLELSVSPEHQVPNQVTVDVFWRHTTVPVRLVVPFPSKGTRAFDGDGREISPNSQIVLKQLLGARLSVVAGAVSKKVRLKLQTNSGGASRKHFLQTLPTAICLNVRLSDFFTDIEHLLSLSDSPDSTVKLTLKVGDEDSFTLNVARYATTIERDGANVLIETAGLLVNTANGLPEDLPVLALRLEDTSAEPIILKNCDEIRAEKSSWTFSPEIREPGTWLVYPGADAKIPFRPTLWAIPGELNIDSELARAINLPDQDERSAALDNLVGKMAEDFAHPGWEEAIRLADWVGHLPLTTLDIWRRFSHSAEAMTALALRYCKLPGGFVSRFDQEVPFAWEVIPFAAWKKAIGLSKEYCRQIFGEDLGKTIFENHIRTRISDLTARHGALSFLLGIAMTEFFPETRQEVQMLRFIGSTARQNLFAGENSHLMNLRRIHADDIWEEGLEEILKQARINPAISRFLHSDRLGYPDAVINAPLLLAAEVITGDSAAWLQEPEKIHLLRTFRAFDSDWFDEAFNLTVARCLAEGLLDN